MRFLSSARCDQLTKRSPLAHCKSVTLVTPPNVEQPQVQDTTPKLQDVITAATPNLSELNPKSWKSSSTRMVTSLL
jgi:hypothetical protein